MGFVMRQVLLALSIFITLLNAKGIEWKVSIKDGLELAKKESKILMIFVEANHCPWCEKMLTTTLSDKDVVRNLNRDYISVKVDADSQEGKEYFASISITPTTYFVTGDKEYLESIEGFNDVEFFFWSMAKAEKKFKELKAK